MHNKTRFAWTATEAFIIHSSSRFPIQEMCCGPLQSWGKQIYTSLMYRKARVRETGAQFTRRQKKTGKIFNDH